MKLSLVVTSEGKGAGKVIPITLSQFLIGRDPQCHLRPVSPVISKRHCALLVKGGKFFVRDFDSTNGTFLNDQQVKGEVEMHDNDRLSIGPIAFLVRIESPAPATKPTPPPAPAPAPAPAAKAPAGEDDESIAAMLLSLQDEGESKPASPLANDAVPQGSTVMDIPSPLGSGDTKEEPMGQPDPKKKDAPKPPGNTQTAAKAILEKYTRRQRST